MGQAVKGMVIDQVKTKKLFEIRTGHDDRGDYVDCFFTERPRFGL